MWRCGRAVERRVCAIGCGALVVIAAADIWGGARRLCFRGLDTLLAVMLNVPRHLHTQDRANNREYADYEDERLHVCRGRCLVGTVMRLIAENTRYFNVAVVM
jgi:hypothetical protein